MDHGVDGLVEGLALGQRDVLGLDSDQTDPATMHLPLHQNSRGLITSSYEAAIGPRNCITAGDEDPVEMLIRMMEPSTPDTHLDGRLVLW